MTWKPFALVLAAAVTMGFGERTVDTRPRQFVIQPIPADMSVREAFPGEPLVVQPLTGTSAARLDEEVQMPFLIGNRKLPAGTTLFSSGFTGNPYCATSKGATVCFPLALPDSFGYAASCTSGLGLEILVFGCDPPKKLSRPVRYSRIDASLGPHGEFGVMFEVDRAGVISIFQAVKVGRSWVKVAGPIDSKRLADGQHANLRSGPLDIDILGVQANGSVTYRINRAYPWTLQTIDLVQITIHM